MATKFLQILSFMAMFLMLTNKVHSQDTTSFTFDRWPQIPNTLTYQGDCRSRTSNVWLDLAGTEPTGEAKMASVGRVLYSRPIRFWELFSTRQASFETTIRFRIKRSVNGAAEGLAFFIAPVNTTIPLGSVGGNLGIYTRSTDRNIFAVEFDTNYNSWDPDYHHVGINIESRASKNLTVFNAGIGTQVTARISYSPNTRIISVVASMPGRTAEISYMFDLKTILPRNVQVGLTASTGWSLSTVGIPEIYAWNFTSTLEQPSVNYEDTYIKEYVQEE